MCKISVFETKTFSTGAFNNKNHHHFKWKDRRECDERNITEQQLKILKNQNFNKQQHQQESKFKHFKMTATNMTRQKWRSSYQFTTTSMKILQLNRLKLISIILANCLIIILNIANNSATTIQPSNLLNTWPAATSPSSSSPSPPRNSLDSPAKQIRQQQQQFLANNRNVVFLQNQTIVEGPVNLELDINNVDLDQTQTVRFNRVRRQQHLHQSSQHQTSNNKHPESECPSNRLLQGLLPPEYAGSPAANKRQHPARAYCDCTADLFGWHVTCFAGISQSPSGNSLNQQNQQPDLSHRSYSASSSPGDGGLHPAFRTPHAQRQRVHKRAAIARWMGDNGSQLGGSSLHSSLSRQSNSRNQTTTESILDTEASSSAHEGFGDELMTTTTTTTTTTSTTAKPNAVRSRIMAPKFHHELNQAQNNNNTSKSDNNPDSDFISLSSSNTLTLMQLQQLDSPASVDNNMNQVNGTPQHQQQHQQHQQTPGSQAKFQAAPNQHLMFQTVPVLFSVKYMRNNMIEIDCDQAAPNYKPAIFQGFNVNEINSFTFNNCQFPNIPYSVLLHRSRAAGSSPSSSSSLIGGGASDLSEKPLLSQSLRPNSRQRPPIKPANSRRRRRSAVADEDAGFDAESPSAWKAEPKLPANGPDEVGGVVRSVESLLAAPADNQQDVHAQTQGQRQHATTGQPEPKVKSLTVNLNSVVDQRTLITVLTGLDLLEELQLNYMQLNVSNFEPDLDSDLSSQIPSATNAPISSSTSSSLGDPLEATSINVNQAAPAIRTQPAGSSNTTSTTSTTTSTTTTSTTSTTTRAPMPARTSTGNGALTPPAINLSATRSALAPPATTTTTTTNTPLVTVSIPTTTTVTNGNGIKPNKFKSSLKPPVSFSQSRPSSISIGAPRGLVIAQATGIPTSQILQTTTVTPLSASETSISPSLGTTSTSTTTTTTTTTPPPTIATTVPAISLLTVTSSSQMRPQTSISSSRQPTLLSLTDSRMVPTTTNNLISVSQPQNTVIYTGSPSSSFQQTNTINRQNMRPISSTPPTSSATLIGASSNGNSQQLRIHSTPSQWYQGQTGPVQAVTMPAAGSRIPIASSTTEQYMQADQPPANPPTSVLAPPKPLAGPLNTPLGRTGPTAHSNGFGTRTSSGSPSSPTSSSSGVIMTNSQGNSFNFPRQQTTRNQFATTPTLQQANQFIQVPGNNQQRQRQQMTISSTAPSTDTTTQFIAAGGRLNQLWRASSSNGGQQFAQTAPNGGHTLSPFRDGFALSGSADEMSTRAFTSSLESSSLSENQAPTANLARFKRSLQELELSFGELLPNLKSLKLESFIDLSHSSSNGKQLDKQTLRLTPRRSGNGLTRFKRQFEPGDAPVKDESHMTGSDADLSPPAVETLVAEESSFEHNSVMAAAPSTNSSIDQDSSRSSEWTIPNSPSTELMGSDSNPAAADQLAGNQQSAARIRHLSLILVKMFSKLSKLRVLQLTSNDIPYWPDNVLLDSRHSLSRLYLISNNIKLLARNSLANLTELETLDLSSNQLRQLNSETFRDLSSLRNFRAVRNLFRKLPGKLFAGSLSNQNNNIPITNSNGTHSNKIRLLENVDFGKNRYLSQISADMFVGNLLNGQKASLTNLNLSDCVLSDQFTGSKSVEHLFSSLPELINISLQGNRFRDLLSLAGLFARNSRLQRLDMSNNQLTTLNSNLFNANASQLTELQLHHNQLSSIPDQFLFNLRKLRRISLAHNKISQLAPRMFLTNQLIEFVDLSHNQLVTLNTAQSSLLPFGHGPSLKHLNLAHNNLSSFEEDIFDITWSFYTSLNSLDLSANNFQGQIPMPIFYTIADEMLLNLGSNSIQSVSVEALVQHEQVIDRYASYEAESVLKLSSQDGGLSAKNSADLNRQTGKVPVVNVKLTGNPIACDCMLEPLISYSRRVAAATNPSLLATLFNGQNGQNKQAEHGLSSSSRYSVVNNQIQADSQNPRNPQLFYQFKFNDLYCAKPLNLQRKLLNHISIGDLLCPITDRSICPTDCQCHYQSAFKTAIVDCNGRQLTQVPEQLTKASNFASFQVESSIVPTNGSQQMSNVKSITSVDKIIIRLDNNQIRSMESLSKLFTVSASSSAATPASGEEQPTERSRFARAHPVDSRSTSGVPSLPGVEEIPELTRSSAEPLSSSPVEPLLGSASKSAKKMSPVAIGRNMRGSQRQDRSRRQADDSIGFDPLTGGHASNNNQLDPVTGSQPFDPLAPPTSESNGDGSSPNSVSTAILETAEEFRNKRYPLTCELYLDHNLIDSIPDSFLEILDQVSSSSMRSSAVPPQAALPSSMLEPPIHTKLNHLHLMSAPTDDSSSQDPMRASASSTTNSLLQAPPFDMEGPAEVAVAPPSEEQNNPASAKAARLFGRQPLNPEKKAALMESITQNVKLNQMQQEIRQQQAAAAAAKLTMAQAEKVSVSPSLVILSLRHNNLSGVDANMLLRLSKLIKSSNTKLYLGHNPFNCSENFAQTTSSGGVQVSPINNSNNYNNNNRIESRSSPEALIPGAPIDDHMLAASDPISGAYLESAADDLSSSASSHNLQSMAAGLQSSGPQSLEPADCPVGQLKGWLTKHHANIGDLDELYCVHMPLELAEKLKLSSRNSSVQTGSSAERLKAASQTTPSTNQRWEHEHPWAASSIMMLNNAGDGANGSNYGILEKNGFSWNSELLCQTAKIIEINTYDLCPYSGIQILDASASGLLSPQSQQILLSVAIVFILISLCLLLMLIYFGDTQTILAFIYIHLNPLYSCLRLNESHLDGDKLYDAFVSYSSADRDIVMELIEKLEQQEQRNSQAPPNYGTDITSNPRATSGENRNDAFMDKSQDSLFTEAHLRPEMKLSANSPSAYGNNTLNRRSGSNQELNTMSRSTSRIMLEDTGKGKAGESAQASLVPYRLCIHERDWLPGHLISWNIVNSVQNSRRTILILSKDFIKSVWFQVEFHTAYYQMLEDKIDRLIVIVRGELPPKNELDKNLAFLLTTKTYLTWGEKWFWERLHYALPHRVIPPTLPTKKSSQPILHQHHHQPKATSVGSTKLSTKLSDPSPSNPNSQKPLIMSNIGKDLLLPVHHSGHHSNMIGSSSSSGSASSSNARSSSSILSGSSTGNLLSPNITHQTTSNDLLSTSANPPPHQPTAIGGSTTRVTIGQSCPSTKELLGDSGRVTGSSLMTADEVTSIMLGTGPASGSNSKLRAKKQEKLQKFVDQSMSDRLNLSEL